MASLVSMILQDFERNKITLPSFDNLRRGVFSPFDGSKLSDGHSHKTLGQVVLELILVKPVNWAKVLVSLGMESRAQTIVVYGPHPSLLMPPSFLSSNRALQRRDVSHGDAGTQLLSNYDQSNQDIAIIGVGLD